ncbi:tripartite tricarboxylate transporter substrate binding protein [Paracoccus sp. JM45]|uniref:Bug family tripartite tricarboxylate transporter substrate binding protein n=1 Tax=Paracoccus sp. JM45 TaxID=2283626 RepID=UPI0015FFAFB8|nr:tripartite tricarboxylate transporter substrate binding protein [Paracoccus sp. JM45]
MNRRHLLATSVSLACAVLGQQALAQDSYPSEPVHITVVWPAGGGHDLVGRLLGHELSTEMGTPVVIDNVTGAGGTTGMQHVADASPDGYTIGVMGLHAISQSYMNDSAPKLDQFDPLLFISDEPAALEISPDTGITTLDEYVTAMHSDPMSLINGNDPQGGNSFVFASVISNGLGVEPLKLPYAGHAATVTALLTGEVQTATLPLSPVMEQAKGGALTILGVASEERQPQLPDAPTFKEQGYDVVGGDFIMVVAPKGMDAAIRQKLSDALLTASQGEGFVTSATKNGLALRQGGPDMAAQELTAQENVIYPVLLDAGLVTETNKR